MRDRSPAPVEDAVYVNRHGGAPVIHGGFHEWPHRRDPGIVHKHVQPAETLYGSGDQAVNRVLAAHVRLLEQDVVCRDVLGSSLKFAARAAGQDDTRALGNAMGSSGSAVVFAGGTVIVATASLALTGLAVLASIGFATALMVLVQSAPDVPAS